MSTSLSRTTSFVRRASVFGVIAVIVLWYLQVQFGIFDQVLQVTPSARPSITTVSYGNCPSPKKTFGAIPKLTLVSYALASGTSAKYSLDKNTQPSLPTTLNVYKLDAIFAGLDDVQRVRATALTFGFLASSEVSDTSNTIWQNADGTRTLTFDKNNKIWTLATNINNTSLTTLNQTVNYSKVADNILAAVKMTINNYTSHDTELEYALRKYDKSFESTTQVSKANLLNLTYYKSLAAIVCQGKDGKPVTTSAKVLGAEYKNQSFTAQVTGTGADLKSDLLNLTLREYKISDTTGTYATATFDEAYSMLQENKGTLYWIMEEGGNSYATYQQLRVTSFLIYADQTKIVYIEPQKYIDSDEKTFYLQPYYQFKGKATLDNGSKADVVFLVPALKSVEYK